MNIFQTDLVKVYSSKWEVAGSRQFSDEEKACIVDNEIVEGKYGLSVCFTLTTGKVYIGLSEDSVLELGESVNPDTCEILTLVRGDETCLKVKP